MCECGVQEQNQPCSKANLELTDFCWGCWSHSNTMYCTYSLASYPGLLAPAFVACSTNAGEGLVKLSHVV